MIVEKSVEIENERVQDFKQIHLQGFLLFPSKSSTSTFGEKEVPDGYDIPS
jgi:hypothetical protein